MSQKLLNMNRWDARRDQLGGVRMPQGVGRSPNIEPRLFPIHCNQLLNRPNREMPAQPILEQRPIRCDGEPDLLVESQQLHDTHLRHFVERDNPTARVFADGRRKMQILPRIPVVVDQIDHEPRRFADAQAGVIHEQDHQVIPAAEGRSEVDGVEDATDFGFGQSEHSEYLGFLGFDGPNPQPGSKGQGRETPERSARNLAPSGAQTGRVVFRVPLSLGGPRMPPPTQQIREIRRCERSSFCPSPKVGASEAQHRASEAQGRRAYPASPPSHRPERRRNVSRGERAGGHEPGAEQKLHAGSWTVNCFGGRPRTTNQAKPQASHETQTMTKEHRRARKAALGPVVA